MYKEWTSKEGEKRTHTHTKTRIIKKGWYTKESKKVKRKEEVVICHNIVIQQQNNVINYRIEQGYLKETNKQSNQIKNERCKQNSRVWIHVIIQYSVELLMRDGRCCQDKKAAVNALQKTKKFFSIHSDNSTCTHTKRRKKKRKKEFGGKRKRKKIKKRITDSRKTIDSSLIYQHLLGNIHYQSLVHSSP